MASWTGSISLPNGEYVPDIKLALNFNQSPGPGSSSSTPDTAIFNVLPSTLPFLAISKIESIPLCFVAGPRWNVLSDRLETVTWFDRLLCDDDDANPDIDINSDDTIKNGNDLDDPSQSRLKDGTHIPWWQSTTRRQSPVGVLVSTQLQSQSSTRPDLKTPPISPLYNRRITEVVFYAEIVPSGSSREPNTIRLFAQPLSSDIATPMDLEMSSHSLQPGEARFCGSPWLIAEPSGTNGQKAVTTDSIVLPRKRPRTNSSTTSARYGDAQYSSSTTTNSSLNSSKRPRMHSDASRNPSSMSMPSPYLPSGSISSSHRRPSGPLHPLSRCTSMTPTGEITPGSTPTSIPPPVSLVSASAIAEASRRRESSDLLNDNEAPYNPITSGSTEAKNKETIARLVMTGMRLYGYQQYSRTKSNKPATSAGTSNATAAISSADAAAAEEYKGLYHQVYKGTVFGMRKYIANTPLHQNDDYVAHLRGVVDRLLCVFCVDAPLLPLERAQGEGGDGGNGADHGNHGDVNEHGHGNTNDAFVSCEDTYTEMDSADRTTML